jgi:UrcA family protein
METFMNKTPFIFLAAAMMAIPPAALAQELQARETVNITAPLLIQHKKLNIRGMHVSNISVEKAVSYADLDLSKETDVGTLRTRVSNTATELCKALETRYPSAVYVPVTNQDCVKAATDGAMATVNEIIAAR